VFILRPIKSSKERKSRKQKKAADDEEDDFEQVGREGEDDSWSREGSISPPGSYHDDVEELLQSFRNERAYESSNPAQRLVRIINTN